jgi:hypothetical protein
LAYFKVGEDVTLREMLRAGGKSETNVPGFHLRWGMAGDRGLAFVLVGLIGSTMVWVGHVRTIQHRAKPAIHAAAFTTIHSLLPHNSILPASALVDSRARIAVVPKRIPLD